MSMTTILAIDPGPEYSAYCRLHDGVVGQHGWVLNSWLLDLLRAGDVHGYVAVIESPQAQDRPLGKLLRDTIWWAARFAESLDCRGVEWVEADERDVALWLTGNRSASNSSVLQSLKDIFGDKTQQPCDNCHASGTVMGTRGPKKCPRCSGCKYRNLPGPLAGLNEHERSSLAAAWWYHKRMMDRTAAAQRND